MESHEGSFMLNTGNEITVDQLKKLLYDMKTLLKKKTDWWKRQETNLYGFLVSKKTY